MAHAQAQGFNERLIDAVECERVLWDLQRKNYNARNVSEAAWRRVAAAVGATVPDVKNRWKNLRDTFRGVFKGRIQAKKSGPGADEVEETATWIFFERLLFLRDTMRSRPTSGNVEPLPYGHSEPVYIVPEYNCDDTPQASAEEISEQMYTNEHASLPSSTGPSSAPAPDAPNASVELVPELPSAGSHKKRKSKIDKYDSEIDMLREILQKKPDVLDHFGAYLVDKMRQVPERLQNEMQLKVLQTVFQFIPEK
ncbi:uncharacterized protein LOC144128248 [Amblyomma americanum]